MLKFTTFISVKMTSKIDDFDRLLIKAVQPREYMYKPNLTVKEKLKRENFVTQYTKIVSDKYQIDLNVSEVKQRWKQLRDNYVRARKKQREQLSEYQKEIMELCSFLEPYLKQNQDLLSTAPVANIIANDFESPQNLSGQRRVSFDTAEQAAVLPNSTQSQSQDEDIDNCTNYEYLDEDFINDADAEGNNEKEMYDNEEFSDGEAFEHTAMAQGHKRKTIDNLKEDFPKRYKQSDRNSGDFFDLQMKKLSSKINELNVKSDVMLQAKARAVLVCSYIDKLQLSKQITCIQRVLEILKKYQN